MKHLENLNDAQKEAVLHKDGPLLIVAGAGAGKTKTITHRILNLIKNGIDPKNILAVTFTNKAAKEMQDRVLKLMSKDSEFNTPISFSEKPNISTFHSLGVQILRENSGKIGLKKYFSILNQSDSLSLIKQSIKKLELDPKQFEPKRIGSTISRQKGDLIDADSYAKNAGNEYFPKIVASIWLEYEKLLKKNGGLDFDDLILKTVQLLEDDKNLREYYQKKWQFIHIDEYQDTNTSQYRFSQLLAGPNKNICVVGDGDQSVYGWRGADFRNILKFEKDHPDAKVVLLEENYRSTANILTAANDIIKKNKERKEKNLFTRKEGGEKIGLFESYDENEEALFITLKSKNLIEQGVSPKDIAVLYRANFQSRALEEAFLTQNIPYQVLGVKFFERREIKDILSFLKASLNNDSMADVKRIINVPPRGIGKVTLLKIFAGQEQNLSPSMQKKVSDFKEILKQIKNKALSGKISETIKFIMKKTGIETALKNGTDEDKERLENTKELVTLALKYDILPPEEAVMKLLEDASLASDQDSLNVQKEKENNAVRLMTVHSSKGLEFPYVFITGMEDGLFPHSGFGDSNGRERHEEERRLFYVAITRAEKKAYLTYTSIRTVFGMKQVNMPSEFITDIDDELLESESLIQDIVNLN